MKRMKPPRKPLLPPLRQWPAFQRGHEALDSGGRKLAGQLSKWEKKMSHQTKIVFISLFCLTMSLFSMTLLYRGLYGDRQSTMDFSTSPGLLSPVSPQLPDSTLETIRRRRAARFPHLPPGQDSITP